MMAQAIRAILLAMATLATRAGFLANRATSRGSTVSGLCLARRIEEALERRGIPVATQAGKGLFLRQEIQDLIAITRVLADRRDTLALGALLRGPLVGLTEETLLDIVWALPRTEEDPARPSPEKLS